MEEGKMISFLDDETDILISGNNTSKKNMLGNKNTGEIGKELDKNHKCLVMKRVDAGEML